MDPVIVTGGTGFAGGHFISRLLMTSYCDVISIERHPCRQPISALRESTRIRRVWHDLRAPFTQDLVDECKGARYLVHLAAEVSGISSLQHPVLTVNTNVMGTFNALELARQIGVERFIYVSSGEAVGAVSEPLGLSEGAPLRPSNPYAASKAAGEELTRAYYYSFGVPGVIVRTMNLFGPHQGVERFVPGTVKKILNNEEITCHVDRLGNPGSRSWLPINHFIEQLAWLTENGTPGDTYHVVGPQLTNLSVIHVLAAALNPIEIPKVRNLVPGPSHDLRYALINTKLPEYDGDIDEDLAKAARWHADHREWL